MDLHRGRIQAQGGGLEKSVAWSQAEPPTVSEGLNMIDDLISQLTPKEYKVREKSFEQARNSINQAAQCGGINALRKKSFRVKGTKDTRVDIDVLNGRAFVDNFKEKN
jgi:hypothetical protein